MIDALTRMEPEDETVNPLLQVNGNWRVLTQSTALSAAPLNGLVLR